MKKLLLHVYEHKYKQLLVLTLFLLLFSIGVLGWKFATTGEFVEKGVSLKGGITLTTPATRDLVVADVQEHMHTALPQADINVRGITKAGRITHVLVEAADATEDELVAALQDYGLPLKEFNTESMSATLGRSFFRQTLIAVLFSFLFMGLVVFITFRVPVPAFFVILAAASDILTTLAVIVLLDVRLSTAGIAAFLMLIGYSVDTDIMLTTRVLKRREGEVFDRVKGALRTGVIMTGTSLTATIISYIFTQSDVIKQIMLILSIGLFFDLFYTWIQNAGILRYYLERKEAKK